jgi:hypothetical protein
LNKLFFSSVFIFITACALRYSSIPSYKTAHFEKSDVWQGRILVFVPAKDDGFTGVHSHFMDSLYQKMKKSLPMKVLYCGNLNDAAFTTRKDYIDATYEWNHTYYGADSEAYRNNRVPECAKWEVDFFNFSFIDSLHMAQSCGVADLSITFGDLLVRYDEKSGKILFNGNYMIWDYRKEAYVAKGRLGPIRRRSADAIIDDVAAYVRIAVNLWLPSS